MAIGTTNFPTSLDTADDLVRATNSASTKLTSGINNSVTSIGVISVALFPSSGIIRINDEIISYTGTSGGNTFTGCSRGFEGTTAASHQNNDNVTLDITAASNNVKNDAIIAIETKLGTGSSTPTANTVMRGTGTGTSAYGQIVNGDVSASAAIAHSKLANMTAGTVMIGNASNVPTATAITGDVTVSNAGVTAIASGVIVDADINASAGIAPTKLNVGSGVATFLSTPSSANLLAAVTDETGTGALVFGTSPTLTTPNIGVATGTSFNSITGLSSTTPGANSGSGSVGTGTTAARADHVHPTTGLGLTASGLDQFATSTSNTIGVGTIELGNVSDTTLSRSAAGTLAVEGVNVVTTATLPTLIPSINKNFFINGDFSVQQRASADAAGFLVDRWAVGGDVGPSQSTSTSSPTGLGSVGSMVITGGTNPFIRQRIESRNAKKLTGQTVTVSAWVIASSSASIRIDTATPATTTDDFSTLNVSNGTAVSVGTSWTRISRTFTAVTGTDRGLEIRFTRVVTSASDSFSIALAQVEIGSSATEFAHVPYEISLERCMRYYQRVQNPIITAVAGGGTALVGAYNYRTILRGIPSATISSTAPNNVWHLFDGVNTITPIVIVTIVDNKLFIDEFGVTLSFTVAPGVLVQHRPYTTFVQQDSGIDFFITLNAEL